MCNDAPARILDNARLLTGNSAWVKFISLQLVERCLILSMEVCSAQLSAFTK